MGASVRPRQPQLRPTLGRTGREETTEELNG